MPGPAPKAHKIQANLFTHAYDGTDETHALDAGPGPGPGPTPKKHTIEANQFRRAPASDETSALDAGPSPGPGPARKPHKNTSQSVHART